MAGVNAQQQNYYKALPSLIKKFEGDFFTILKKVLSEYHTCENTFSIVLAKSALKLIDKFNQISETKDTEVFLQENDIIFKTPPNLELSPIHGDEVSSFIYFSFMVLICIDIDNYFSSG